MKLFIGLIFKSVNIYLKNICNFEIIYRTYIQKCKHISKENIHFILFFPEQEEIIKNYNILSNYSFYKDTNISLNIEETLLKNFWTYSYDEAISIINNKNNLLIDNKELINLLEKNIVKRNYYKKDIFSNIVFFGTSVTEQKYSYVNYLTKNIKESIIVKKGYSGCHINQAIWLVNDIINIVPKPKCCFLEWITSVYKPQKENLRSFLIIIVKKLIENDIIPIFLYLYKTDIEDYLDIIDTYEEIANYYKISTIHIYKVLKEINIDYSLILKDTCHTIYEGSNLYGSLVKNAIFDYFLNDNYHLNEYNKNISEKILYNNYYENINVLSIDKLIDCTNIEFEVFNDKKYYKIYDKLTINLDKKNYKLIAINILYYKNNGYILINNNKILTWDRNCYYKRYGYVNLNIDFKETVEILITQDKVNTTECKYDTIFPDDKYILLSELIYILKIKI